MLSSFKNSSGKTKPCADGKCTPERFGQITRTLFGNNYRSVKSLYAPDEFPFGIPGSSRHLQKRLWLPVLMIAT
jgi:hypothetical protein